jgi:predicted nucleic acid-binding protein
MSGNGVLVDSVILIDHFNGISTAASYLETVRNTGCVSAVTRAEVLTGLEGDARDTAGRFLDCFRFLPLDKAAADLAADLRRRHGWKLPDAFQAALALLNDLHLATRDAGDFDPRTHSFVHVPYSL